MNLSLILTAYIAMVCVIFAGPSPEINIKEISGKVEMGICISSSSISCFRLPSKGDVSNRQNINVKSTLILIIKDVKGVDPATRKRITAEFSMWINKVPMISQDVKEILKRLDNDEGLFMWIAPVDDLESENIKIGSIVTLIGISYFADDFGGHGKHKELIVNKE